MVQDLLRGEEGRGGTVLEEGGSQKLGPGLKDIGGRVTGGEVRMGEDLCQETSTAVQLESWKGGRVMVVKPWVK